MPTQDEVVHELPVTQNSDRPMTVGELAKQSHLLQEILEQVLVEGVHYGTTPGTDKPSLYLPGAEKICSTFRLAPKPSVEDLSDVAMNLYRYRVTVSLYTINGGLYVGAAVGEASSLEEKYQWQKAVCMEQWEETDATRRRKKYKNYDKKNPKPVDADDDKDWFIIYQVQREAPDLANTVLKMAFKRAFVSATRGATAASDILEVDLEEETAGDLAREDRAEKESKPAPKPKKREPAPIIPYGKHQGKQINDPNIPVGDLEWLGNALADAIRDPAKANFKVKNQALVLAIDAEVAHRKKQDEKPKEQPKPEPKPKTMGDTRPPMDDGAWTGFVDLAKGDYPKVVTQVLNDWELSGLEAIPGHRRWEFYDAVNAAVNAMQ